MRRVRVSLLIKEKYTDLIYQVGLAKYNLI